MTPFDAAPSLEDGDTLTYTVDGSDETKSLPLVLAGPILRRVTRDSVTVWAAIRESRTLVLSVAAESDPGTNLMYGKEDTVQVGSNLHVAAVTATRMDGVSRSDLQSGPTYTYDISFGQSDLGLDSPGVLAPNGSGIDKVSFRNVEGAQTDPPYQPAFTFPPKDPDDLRLLYGSCRKAHGGGRGALNAAHDVISYSVGTDSCPHALILGGDQIYADDVADQLLPVLTNLATGLLGFEETVPSVDGEKDLTDIWPGERRAYIKGEGFSAGSHGLSHLAGFGEYCALYLMAWSDELWPAKEDMGALPDSDDFDDPDKDLGDIESRLKEKQPRLEAFRETVADVRRALANVPTYMIFDDHEVTDDWFLTGEWVKDVLSSDGGKRVIRNGMSAYAVFQAWGNTPGRFETGEPGRKLLDGIESQVGTASSNGISNVDAIDETLGIPIVPSDGSSITRSFDHEDRMDWHFAVEFGDWELVVVDTRTRRGYPVHSDPPVLIRPDQQDAMFPGGSTSIDLSVVVTPVPLWAAPIVDSVQEMAWAKQGGVNWLSSSLGYDTPISGNEKADNEHWRHGPHGMEGFLSRLVRRGPNVNGKHKTRAVILSGDVHYGFSTRMEFWGQQLYGLDEGRQAQAVSANLTASAAKNQSSKTGLLHTTGNPLGRGADPPPLPSFAFAGIDLSAHPDVDPGSFNPLFSHAEPDHDLVKFDFPLSAADVAADKNMDEVELLSGIKRGLGQEVREWMGAFPSDEIPHDWEYRVDYLQATPQTNRAIEEDGASVALRAFESPDIPWGKRIVGRNNLGEVTFEWTDATKTVQHNQHWYFPPRDEDNPIESFPLSQTEISMAFDEVSQPSGVTWGGQ